MVDLYKKYYLDSETIKEILQNGIVVFDTSALLDLYYYSSETRNEIFNKAFNYLKGRLWIPAQVYFEYLKNKSKVSEKPILSYERLLTKQSKDGGYVNSIVDKTKMLQGQSLGEIKNQLNTLKEQTLGTDKHPYLSPDVYAEYESVLSVVENQLTDFSSKTADFQTRIQKEIEKSVFFSKTHKLNLLIQNTQVKLVLPVVNEIRRTIESISVDVDSQVIGI